MRHLASLIALSLLTSSFAFAANKSIDDKIMNVSTDVAVWSCTNGETFEDGTPYSYLTVFQTKEAVGGEADWDYWDVRGNDIQAYKKSTDGRALIGYSSDTAEFAVAIVDESGNLSVRRIDEPAMDLEGLLALDDNGLSGLKFKADGALNCERKMKSVSDLILMGW